MENKPGASQAAVQNGQPQSGQQYYLTQPGQPAPLYTQQPIVYNVNDQPPPYGQQPINYTPQQPVTNGQSYPQVSYANNQGPTVVVLNSRRPTSNNRTDWAIPSAKGPGIAVLVVAAINLAAFIGIGVTSQFYVEFVIASAFYLVGGVLAVVGARPQRTHGVAIGCLVMACVTLIMAFAQIIQRGLAISFGQMLVFWGIVAIGQEVIYVNMALLFVAFVTFGLCIALIVIPSKVLCCGTPVTPTRGVVLSPPSQQTQISHIEN